MSDDGTGNEHILSNNDFSSIIILLTLYYLQGIITGLYQSLQLILTKKNASYFDQGLFFSNTWPISVKLLWAPFVDAIYWTKIGRRKSWLIPVQFAMAFILIMSASFVHRVFGETSDLHEDIYCLMIIFTMVSVLLSLQDIVVDAMGLSILKNIAWSSICKNSGITLGILTGNSLFLILQSADFSNKYIRCLFKFSPLNNGILNLKDFMRIIGIIYLITTVLILMFVKEKDPISTYNLYGSVSISLTVKLVWKVLKLKQIHRLIIFLLTWKIAFAFTKLNSVKVIEAGVPLEILSMINIPIQLTQVFFALFIGKCLTIDQPLQLFKRIYPLMIFITFIITLWIFLMQSNGELTIIFIGVFAILQGLFSLILSTLIIAKGHFFAQISDQAIGGSYLTLLHTFSNLGYLWPETLSYFLLEFFSNYGSEQYVFFYLTAGFLSFGVLWFLYFKNFLEKLQLIPREEWSLRMPIGEGLV